MDFDLSPDHELIRRTVREFAEAEVAPMAEELDRTKSFPYEIVAKLGKLGLMGIPFPLQYGGGGGDTLAYVLAVEELTRVDSSVAITVCRFYRDAKILTIGEGTDEIQQMVIARALGA